MRNSRMYDLLDTYAGPEVTVAIKKEGDSGKTDQEPAAPDYNVIPLPQHVATLLKDIRRACESGSFADVDWRIHCEAPAVVKAPHLRARWERIEGVGLRCTWVEQLDTESDTGPDAGAGQDAATRQNGPDEQS
ncbi:hypothetical protein [Paraburkholderia humisilvae]|uniref:Uncharacterized protein n=2 Tax=Paraburkholderia humisilvae TaxID=627669 RepID=A0A6J5D5W3_9BURK|nr:hypothetical protein LMG29542_00774 [Paraburkholderia humisilvae]